MYTMGDNDITEIEEALIWIFVALIKFGVPFGVGVYIGHLFW